MFIEPVSDLAELKTTAGLWESSGFGQAATSILRDFCCNQVVAVCFRAGLVFCRIGPRFRLCHTNVKSPRGEPRVLHSALDAGRPVQSCAGSGPSAASRSVS